MLQKKMKLFVIVLGTALCFLGCSDYAQNIEDNYQEWLKAQASSSSVDELSSSSTPLSSSVDKSSSSSVAVCTNTYGTNTVTDCRDNQTYKTVVIGMQTWMAENLNYAVGNSWCCNDIEYTESNCSLYGRLYTWAAVMGVASTYNSAILGDSVNHQGICPNGWHVPRSSEWTTLENYVGGSSTAGTYLKATSGWNEDGNGTDTYDFSALPGGRYYGEAFASVGYYGSWWVATEYSSTSAYTRYMGYNYTDVNAGNDVKTYVRSLRCLKDSSSVIKSSSSSVRGSSSSVVVSSSSAKVLSSSSTPLSSSVDKSSSSSVGISSSSIGVCTNTYGTNTVMDCRDNQTYKTVVIGAQTWMAENLNYADSAAMTNLKGNSWCYNNSADSCTKYGRLYTWTAAMNIASSYQSASAAAVISTSQQGVCPTGWHIPTDAEWTTLENYVGGSSTAGTALKSTSGWYNDGNGTDAYGFSALPGGYYIGSDFRYVGYYGYWWSATEYSSTDAYYRHMTYGSTYVNTGNGSKTYGRSLRCLKD